MRILIHLLAAVGAVAVAIALVTLLADFADARTRSERIYDHGFVAGERYAEGGYLYSECKPRVTQTGEAKLWTSWARSYAWKTWREAVRRDYGERFMANAVHKTAQCDSSSVNGTYPRCTVSAIPCASRAIEER